MDRQARILGELSQLFCEIFARDDLVLTLDTTAADVQGWDSMKHIEITIAIEEKYGIRFSTRDVDGLRTVGDLVAIIVRKTS